MTNMTDETNPKPVLTVRALMAILSECSPAAAVDFCLPEFIALADSEFLADLDGAASCETILVPEVVTSLSGPNALDARGQFRRGLKPNHVSIGLSLAAVDALIQERKRAIASATA